MKVKLSEILMGMEFSNTDNGAFLNIKTGEVVLVSDPDITGEDEEFDTEYYDSNEDYISLPDDYDIDEYRMMQDFIGTVSDDSIAQTLSISLQGSGAFRRFKDHLYQFEIQDEWFACRDNKYKQVAIGWCRDNDVDYIDDEKKRHAGN